MSMNCRDCSDLLSALLDGELSLGEIAEVKAHLERCPSCCRECALLCCLDAEVGRAKAPQSPAGLWEKVEEKIDGSRGSTDSEAGSEFLSTGTDGRVIDFARARARLSRLGRI